MTALADRARRGVRVRCDRWADRGARAALPDARLQDAPELQLALVGRPRRFMGRVGGVPYLLAKFVFHGAQVPGMGWVELEGGRVGRQVQAVRTGDARALEAAEGVARPGRRCKISIKIKEIRPPRIKHLGRPARGRPLISYNVCVYGAVSLGIPLLYCV